MTPRELTRLEREIELRLLERDRHKLNARIGELERILAPAEPLDELRAELRERGLGG